MANIEHLKILEQGVEVWNEWRKTHPYVKPDLTDAYLEDANLEGADLRGADLSDADLSDANLRGAFLTKAYLDSANLIGANLMGANLMGANLTSANLEYANLESADLTKAVLMRIQALEASFHGATLTGSIIEDWHINTHTNLNDVICDYAYLECDEHGRRPHTGTFAPGDFAKLVQQSFDTIDLIFREGLGWKAFAYSFNQVEVLHEDAHMEVRSIENKGDGVVIVKVATAPNADKALIHSDFTQMYEFANKALAGYQKQLEIQGNHINQLLGIVGTSQEVQRAMAEQRSGDNYYGDIKAVNFTPHGTAMGGVFNDFSNTQDLTQAASQIQALLAQLQQQGHSPEDAQQQVADDLAKQADQDPALLGKLVKWGQKLGDATVTDVVKGVVKLALRSAGVPLP